MKSFVLVLSLLISLSFQSCLNVDFKQLLQDASVHFPQKDGILILTTETIDEAIKVHPRLAILFFAPWCPHCKALYPEMAEALKNPELKKMGVVFGRVDIEYNTKVQEDYQIHGMPTVIYFENGAKKEVFGGGRTADKIVEWFYKRLVSKTHKLETLEEIKAYEKPRGQKFIYFGKDPKRIKEYEEFIETRDDITFGIVSDPRLIKEYGKEPETLVLFKGFDEPPYVNIKNMTKENINNEMKLNQYPLIFENDDCNDLFQLLQIYRFPLIFLLRNDNDKEKTPQIDKTFLKHAKEHRSKAMFCKLDINNPLGQRIIKVTNLTRVSAEKNEPGLLIMDLNKQFNRWNFDEFYKEFTIENMEKMINDYMDGKIKPPTKSEEIPEKQEKTVYKLVNKSFQKEVLDSDINVFVKFYSPHCGHCIRLQPAFEELAEKLKYNKNLIVAEYNLIANDFDWFRIRGYPTLVMFKAGDKKNHIIYEGNRTVEDMMNFVISNLGEVKDKKEEEKKKKEEEDKKKKEEEERKRKEEDKKKKEEEERKRKEEEIKKKEEQKKIEEEMKKKIEEKQKKIGEEQAKINEEENKAKEKKAKKKKAKEKKN